MANKETLGASFSIDTTALKAGLQQANRLIKESQSEFKAAASGMDDWSKSQQGIEAKIKSLNKITEIQQKKVDALTDEYNRLVSDGLDPTSAEAIRLRTQINNEQAALNKNKAEIDKQTKALDDLGNASEEAADDIDDTSSAAEKSSEGFTVMKGALASLVADGINSAISALKDLAVEADTAYSTLQAQTGLSAQEMNKFKGEMDELYANNYGESMEDLAEAMAQVAKSTQETDPSVVGELTKNAIALRDTFGYEINESIRSVKALMTNFGVSGEEAFNLIVQGAQNGLDYSDEMIDSINEYSVQFGKLGFSADDMFNIFAEGAKSGAWNLDKVGDAVKEFSIRAIDGSKTTIDAYSQLGLNADEMMQTFTKGGDEASTAFRDLIKQLVAVDDKVQRDAIGVELFGTQWEDLGVEAVASLATTEKSVDSTSEAMKDLDANKYNNLQSQIQTLGRTFKTKLSDTIKKDVIPQTQSFIKSLQDNDTMTKFATQISKIAKTVMPPLTKAVKFCAENIEALATGVMVAVTAMAAFKAAMAVTTAITAATTAVSALSAGVGVATKAQTIWNAAMSANPIGAVLTAVGLLTAGIVLLVSSQSEAEESTDLLSESQREAVTAAQEAADAYKETRDAADELASSQIANVDYVESNLLPQLRNLVDENGNVKQGEEARAQFILGQLNEALDTEYNQLSDIVDANGQIKDSIYDVIEAKKAQILLSSYEESYKQAVENVAGAEKARATNLQQLYLQQSAVADAENNLAQVREEYKDKFISGNHEERAEATAKINEAVANVNTEKRLLGEKEQAYNDSESDLYQYYKDINDYETASTLVTQGETQKAIGYLNNLGSGYQTAASTAKLSAGEQKKVLEQQVIDTEVNAQLMEKAYEDGVEGVSEEMVKTAREQAENAKEEFHKVGGNITKGIAEGAEGEEKTKWTLSGAMSRLINGAVNAAKKAAGIQSPSKLFKKEVGKFIGLGVAVGIDDSTKSVVKSVKNQVKSIQRAYDVGEISTNVKSTSPQAESGANDNVSGGVTVYQTNNYSQAHSRYELYKSKKQTEAAVRLAMGV